MSAPLDLPIYNNYTLNLPAWFATATKNYGNPKDPIWFALANPTTTARNISNRKHEHSIDIARKSITKPELVKNQWDNVFSFNGNSPYHLELPKDFKKNMTLEHFSELDQKRIEKMKAHPNENFGNYPVLARGRPEELPKNVVYNRHHKNHDLLQKYGQEYLNKVKEVEVGRPIRHSHGYIGNTSERSIQASPVSSRTGSSSSGSKSSASSGSKSRLSSLASSLRSSNPAESRYGGFESNDDSEEDSDSGSDDEEERKAERDRQRGLFGRNPLGSASGSSKSGSSKSGSSRSSRSSKPSVSRGKPPLKRPEPKPKTIAGTTAPKPLTTEKKTGKRIIKKRPPVELVEETDAGSEPSEPPAPKPKGTTRWAKPTTAEKDEPLVQKARGRKPKYATKEEAYLAKLEQNKLGKQRKAEALRKAKEEAKATTGTGIKKKRIHGVDYVLEIDETAPVEHLGKTHIMPDGTIMVGATHPSKPETQEERRFKFEEEQRKKHIEKLTADTEKLREKEEKRLAKVSAKKSKPVKAKKEMTAKEAFDKEYEKENPKPKFKKNDIPVRAIHLKYEIAGTSRPYTVYANTNGELIGKPVYHFRTNKNGKTEIMQVGTLKTDTFQFHNQQAEKMIDGLRDYKNQKILPIKMRLVDKDDGTIFSLEHQINSEK